MIREFCFSLTILILMTSPKISASILQENDLYLDDFFGGSGITEQEFYEIAQRIEDIYDPISGQIFAKIVVDANWENSKVGASADQFGRSWFVRISGGLARRPEITRDGLAMAICHEIGHHMGGYPFSSIWAATEGQSDYFATLSCAREIWRDELDINASFRASISDIPKALCDQAWASIEDQNLCYRSIAAGKSVTDLLSARKGLVVSYDEVDSTIVSKTNKSHPNDQCRLDTYIAGAICDGDWDTSKIPGIKLRERRNSREAEQQSADAVCSRRDGYQFGTRPLCWFAPIL